MSDEQPAGLVTDQNPIINNPYIEPERHWAFATGERPRLVDGRRLAGYLPPARGAQLDLTQEQQVGMTTVNTIRERVRDWRDQAYPGATQITQDLFRHWFSDDREGGLRPFFAQREAIETIAFLTEAPPEKLVGITITQVEAYERWAIKLATGAGKTLVMAMTIAWSGLNKVAAKRDTRFTDAFLVVCPNLTVKQRLSGEDGLIPSDPASAFVRFDLIPGQYAGMFGAVRVMVTNWHQLAPREDPKRSVLKRGPESDTAFASRVLRDLGNKRRIMVLNDEAHHAWRIGADDFAKASGDDKKDAEQATVWIDGLDRIHRARGLLRCIDYSATPMYPGVAGKDRAFRPFEWIVCDFALVDAIESGLVKVPRVPTDDNAGTAVPKYRNLWKHIKSVLPKRTDEPGAQHPLTDYLAHADGPLKNLAAAWEATFEQWHDAGRTVPPVMIIVCNDTRMAEMLERHIAKLAEAGRHLVNIDGEPDRTIRIDTKLLNDAEQRDDGESASDAAERLRTVIATVGREGEPGEKIRCVISVGMLSEGWDARNVTQILGLRAFNSQLLAEQVVGRGLRRSDYSDLSQPEYVDVYGVPFQLLPFAKGAGGISAPPDTTRISTVHSRDDMRLEWPNVEQVLNDIHDQVECDFSILEPVHVSAINDPNQTYVEFDTGESRTGFGGTTQDRKRAYAYYREQRLAFRLAAEIARSLNKHWLFPQLLKIVERFIAEKVTFDEGMPREELSNMHYVIQLRERITVGLRDPEGSHLVPILNEYAPTASTDGRFFNTVKKTMVTTKSHISHVVCDSTLERTLAGALESDDRVQAYAKNDRLFLEIPYRYLGVTHRYRPDFIIRLVDGTMLLIEGKGQASAQDDAKHTAAKNWIEAVNNWGQLGTWHHAVCHTAPQLTAALDKFSTPVPA